MSVKSITHRLLAVAFAVLVPLAASAYTVVLRSGQRVQIPDSFVVTTAGITYAEAPRMERTIQLSVINIRATEAANREAPGALLARIDGELPVMAEIWSVASQGRPSSASVPAQRTITNADLERFRREREANEVAFDRQQTERGLPTLAEIRQREAAEDLRMSERSREAAIDRTRSEGHWRERATAVRAELNAVEAQLAVVRSQYRSVPLVSLRSPQVDIDGLPLYPDRVYGVSPQADGYVRSRLLRDRLRLQQQRAVIQSRWNDLQEEARRAGAPPGWLRP